MSGPDNVIMGELDEPTNLPVTTVPEDILAEEKKLAKYSQTAEFKRLRDFMEARIKFFQTYLPDGTSITAAKLDNTQMAAHWLAANIVIAEFQSILNEYDNSAQAVKVAENAGR